MLTLLFAFLASPQAHADPLASLDKVADFRELRLASGAPLIPRTAYEKAAEGKPQAGLEYGEGYKAGKAWGVDVDIEHLWMAVNGVEEQDDYFDGVDVSTVIRGDKRGTSRLLFQLAPIPLASDRWWVVEQHHNRKMYEASSGGLWEQSSKSVENPTLPDHVVAASERGIPIAWAESAWLLIPTDDGRTIIEYYTYNDPGGYIPTSLASRFATGAVKRYLADLEAYGRIMEAKDRAGFVKPDQTPI